jgi:iron complex transport system ATP-binding protein
MALMLTVSDGRYGYKRGDDLFENLNFSVDKNEILGILGPNGVGKTTLLRCILSLLQWKSGCTLIDGIPVTGKNKNAVWGKIGYVPQNSSTKFSYSVMDMVLMGRSSHLRIYNTPSAKDYEIATQSLEQVGIFHLRNKRCNEISGGESQLVLIARALAVQPRVIILDEPESHLDFRNQLLVLSILDKIVHEQNLCCVINTHYPEHAMRLADKTLILGKDKKHLFGMSEEVITVENLQEFFGVEVKILPFENRGVNLSAIVPISLKTT